MQKAIIWTEIDNSSPDEVIIFTAMPMFCYLLEIQLLNEIRKMARENK